MSNLTPDTEFSGTCPECGRPAHYVPLPGGYAPRSPFMTVTCRDCGSKVRLTATRCTVCHVQAIERDSELFAGRGLDWPLTAVLTPGGHAYRVHKACASEAQWAVNHASDLDIDVNGVGRWTTNGHVIPADSAAMLVALGLAQGLDVGATAAAREAETAAFLTAYRERMANHVPDAEELYALHAAFGPGARIVNVITGQETQL
jgi:hypothetical protein